MKIRYSLGIDFGSLSARAVLFQIEDGKYVESFDVAYKHGIIENTHPYTGEVLPVHSALQMPEDYLEALCGSVKGVIKKSGINACEICCVSVDFTSCSLVTLDEGFRPLCWNERYKSSRHSYVKMWKQHTAAEDAKIITELAGEHGKRFGGKILSEWAIPKILETFHEDPEVYEAAYRFMEAGDWIVYQLTGQESMSYCSAGFKFMWTPEEGYPTEEFWRKFGEGFVHVSEKFVPLDRILALDQCAGYVTQKAAEMTGLPVGIPVAPMRIDGHSSAIAMGCSKPGRMAMIAGTSLGMMMLSKKNQPFPGVCGVCYGSIIPGLYGYEAGLSSCGDVFQWFADNCVPASYIQEASDRKIPVLALLTEKMTGLKPGQSGLIAMDWWNGNRSILVDELLTGGIIGFTLQTKPEEILMALFEAVCFGAKTVADEYSRNGIVVREIMAVGGIMEKNQTFVQMMADVCDCMISVPEMENMCALGTAIFAASVTGKARGGYDTISDAADKMGCKAFRVVTPNVENVQRYKEIYEDYKLLHDYFGRGENDVMKRLLERRKRF